MLAQHFGHAQRQVRRGDALGEFTMEVNADHFGHEEGHRLAEHPGLGLDAAHAPADHAEAVDHRGVRVGADEGVGIENTGLFQHALGEIFEVHLVNDPDAGRYHGESFKGLLTPLEKFVALPVANELDRHVAIQSRLRPGKIHLHRVIHHEIDRHERLDLLGRSAHPHSSVAHGGQIDQ